MAVIEGGVSAALAGVGAQAASGLHVINFPIAHGAGGWFRIGTVSGTMAAGLAANAEIFQFRYVTAASRIALVYKVLLSAGANVAATTAALLAFRMTVARAWTAAGTGGARVVLTGDNAQLRTDMATSEVNDAGIATTAALAAGTKTLDTTDIGALAFAVGTGAITVGVALPILAPVEIFNPAGEGGYPLTLAHQEGFVLRNGTTAWPAGMTWKFSVNVLWAEVPAY